MNSSKITGKACLLVLLWALSVAPGFATEEPPISLRVELNDGRFFSGTPVSFRDDLVLIRAEIDGGEFERGFPKDSVAGLHFSDTEIVAEALELTGDGRVAEALPLLERIWLPRAPFLPVLDSETIALLAELPAGHLHSGDLYRAVGLAQRLLPHAEDPPVADGIQEVILLGHFRLKLPAETELRARKWIQTQPRFPRSALGWRILAELALEEARLEDALWIALQPVALADAENIEHLGHCYALAIHALHQQEQTERASALFSEMRQRGLAWPESEKLQETKSAFAALHAEVDEPEQAAPELDLDLRPPEKDLNLPIDNVRKVLSSGTPP